MRVDRANPQRYESLPVNESKILSVLVKNATIINGRAMPPFTGDIGIVANRRVHVTSGTRELQTTLTIDDLGVFRGP